MLPQAGNSILPVNRGAIIGTNTYHRYLVYDTTPIGSQFTMRTLRRWHNELDRIYFQIEWQNPLQVDVTGYIDVFLVPDNVEDTEPYASYQLLLTQTGVGQTGIRSFPIGGLPMYGSMEYICELTTNNTVSIEVRLWAVPELWYSFRQVEPAAWTPPGP